MKKELLQPSFFFFFLHRWHQQLLVILCFLKDVQLLIWRKKSICGNVCESVQARGYTMGTADVRYGGCLLEPFHKCFWAFLLCVPRLCTYCGSSRSSQREWYVWADGVRQHTCSPHFHWLIASSRCRCNSWLVSEILQTLKFGAMIQIHGSGSSSDNQLPCPRSKGWNGFFLGRANMHYEHRRNSYLQRHTLWCKCHISAALRSARFINFMQNEFERRSQKSQTVIKTVSCSVGEHRLKLQQETRALSPNPLPCQCHTEHTRQQFKTAC